MVLLVSNVKFKSAISCNLLYYRFAFNCGSTENLECKLQLCQSRAIDHKCIYSTAGIPFYSIITFYIAIRDSNSHESYHSVPSIIAINMILAASAGGLLSVIIASWAQVSQVKWYN